ncbi:PEP-CTERM sorting domain-containing protein [Microcystis aeruginosa]|mgnify:CR=1 FL=1|uniref:PEP-CTERM sorting domain-containing protein n=1 Tax=Microcystis aeruginosa TaxID=1126 RepID=UPI00232A8676|nr:PEP-CTERM sorting domain-containing protein [Microcystis aeruginosa]
MNTEIDTSTTPPVVMPTDQKPVIPPQKILTNSKDIALVGGLGMAATSDFRQSVHQTKVPEPGTILGLLAVGGLGLVSRFKKQK